MSAKHTTYPHMCRDGHAEIGHSDNEHEMCPLCRAVADRDELLKALKEMRINLQRIAERVSMRQVSAAMDCIGIAMTETDAAIAHAEGGQS